MKWPFGMSEGEWTWKSFVNEDPLTTIMIENGKGFQHIVALEWANFDGRWELGRGDAEDFATLICTAVNEYLHNHPELRLTK